MIDYDLESKSQSLNAARIKVIGVGGGGSNMINSMIDTGFENIEFIVANTDAQALISSKALHKIQLGAKATRGLGAGANPSVGRVAAEEDIHTITRALKDSDIVFLVGGLGGGTGSGALPVIARALKDKDVLTVAVVTKPFKVEGRRRSKIAQDALNELKQEVDTLIVIPNQKLLESDYNKLESKQVSFMDALSLINGVLNQFVRSISDIITKPGHINVDFADIKAVMKQKGYAVIGTGHATGENRAKDAANLAISSPLLDNMDIRGAQGVILHISGSSNLGLHEMSTVAEIIYDQAHPDANIILGTVVDETLGDEVMVTVIATGFTQATVEPPLEIKRVEQGVQDKKSDTINIMPAHENPSVDLNNIDIPAIMRRIAQEKQN